MKASFEMGRACRAHGGDDECIQNLGGKFRRKVTTRKVAG
jgi:hypothetical protein